VSNSNEERVPLHNGLNEVDHKKTITKNPPKYKIDWTTTVDFLTMHTISYRDILLQCAQFHDEIFSNGAQNFMARKFLTVHHTWDEIGKIVERIHPLEPAQFSEGVVACSI
jgi:hypothetical protein